jgi:hypothetical protein
MSTTNPGPAEPNVRDKILDHHAAQTRAELAARLSCPGCGSRIPAPADGGSEREDWCGHPWHDAKLAEARTELAALPACPGCSTYERTPGGWCGHPWHDTTLAERQAWANRMTDEARGLPRHQFIAAMDRLVRAGYRTWWLSPEGSELTGPFHENEAQQRWQPGMGVWRGAAGDNTAVAVQPAHPWWGPGHDHDATERDVHGMTSGELADQLGQLPGLRADYRDAVIATAAARLRAARCRCCVNNECECGGTG